MNVVMTGSGKFVEVQGTAEGLPFSKGALDSLVKLAEDGINNLITIQKRLIEEDVISY
jgi:ribonuclease PH